MKEKYFMKKRKQCPLTVSGIKDIDYKDVELLKYFVTERGKILPRRISGISYYNQKKIKRAIKQARYMALLSFVVEN